METHLELYERDLRASGVTADEAHRRARAEFGSVEARKDDCRAALGLRVMDEIRGDVLYALRLLRRSPGFTLVAVASLALGIGANTAIFSLVDMVMLKTLPVQDPSSLVFVETSGGKSGGSSGPPYPLFERMRDTNRFLTGIAAVSEDRFKVTIDGVAEQVRGQSASGNYFELLGIQPEFGRLLTPADDSVFGQGGPDGGVAVISHSFWRRRFASDPAVLGRTIQVGTRWVTIVGVTPPEFFGLQTGSPIDLTIPMMLAGNQIKSKGMWWMSAVARIRPGATTEQARAELDALFGGYMPEIGMKREGYFSGVALVAADRGLNALRRQFSEPLLIIMAIVAAVLLIGCANVANLLLARASARRNEMSVRFAIGASRARVLRQLLTEGAVLVALGTVAGLGLAQAGVSFLVGLFADRGAGILLEPRYTIDGGFRRDAILSLEVDATIPPPAVKPQTPAEHRQDHAARAAMWDGFANRAAALPNVASLALGTMAPLTGRDRGVSMEIEGRTVRKPDNGTHVNTVTSGYFTTLGIPLVSGRLFTPRDTAAAPRIAILNQTAARTWFPDVSPIGMRIKFPGQLVEDWYEVVGVVGDARYVNLRTPDGRMVYIPLRQALDPISGIMVVARTNSDPVALVPALRHLATQVIPGGFLTRIGTMNERVDRSLLRERLLSLLATFFGILALTLACVGLYGVLSYTVVRRFREIGIRMAVGASHTSVAWMILREMLALVAAGITLGTGCAALAERPISSQFFGVTPGDPLGTAAAIGTLLTVTVAAAYLPARRAARIDPVTALRTE